MAASLLTLLRWPLWVAELATGAKSFVDNPLIGSRRLNAMGLHRLRLRAAHAMTAWRRRLLANGISREDRETFQRQGFVEWRGVLSPEAFERMRAGIMERAWPARELVQGNAFTRRMRMVVLESGPAADKKVFVGERRNLLIHHRQRLLSLLSCTLTDAAPGCGGAVGMESAA